jgi:hypothetical protein
MIEPNIESSSPPRWAQMLMQQIAHSTATQEERAEAQDERIKQLEELLRKATPTQSSTEPLPEQHEVTTDKIEPETRYPRARLPDPATFKGTRSEWPVFRTAIENKIALDAKAIGDLRAQFLYVFSRLEGIASKNVVTFVRQHRENGDPRELIQYLEGIYGDPNATARAAQRLRDLRQGDNQPFTRFLPALENEFADSGAMSWPDDAKRSILLGCLNKSMRTMLVHRGIPEAFNDLIARLHQISTDLDLLKPREERPRVSHMEKHSSRSKTPDDSMDWTPTSTIAVNTSRPSLNRNGYASQRPEDQHLLGKRAKWVSREELDRRRDEGRCLRCGRDGCMIGRCPLKPAIPSQNPPRHRVATAAVEESSYIASKLERKENVRVAKASHPKVENESEGEYISTSESEKE